MSMLAEKKQKQKWTLNPRGKYWSDDSNKFGQKMLEKMGWTAGKGLGAKEDGITEHIKQSYKNDTRGIGFEDKGDQWTKHEVDFTSLLKNLSENTDAGVKKPETSLEKKSQTSRARVHYHKFTRGKDLSRYSEKDLANVFGRKTLEKRQVQEEIETVETSGHDFGVMTVNGGSMADYFKTKIKNVYKAPSSESDDDRPAFGFGYVPPSTETKLENDKPSEKKKKKTKVVINECFDNHGFVDFVDTQQESESSNGFEGDMVFDNPGLNLDDSMEENAKKRAKKRKLETIDEETIEGEANVLTSDVNLGASEATENGKMKKKKKKVKIVDPVSEELSENAEKYETNKEERPDLNSMDITTETTDGRASKLKKKKKNKGIDNLACAEILNETENGESDHQRNQNGNNGLIFTEPSTDLEIKKEKKVKKKKRHLNDADTVDLNDSVPTPEAETNENGDIEIDGTVSKRKLKKLKGIDNTACTEVEIDEKKLKKKQKKSKMTDTENGVDNPACTAKSVQQSIEETITSMSDAIDNYQLELENQMNERKARNEQPEEGTKISYQIGSIRQRKLKLKEIDPKKSVKSIIKGKVKYNFEGSSLPKIAGYGLVR